MLTFVYHKLKLEQHYLQYYTCMSSHSRAIRSKSQKKIVKFGPMTFLNCENTCHLTDIAASIYGRKMDARPFDTIQDILRRLSLVQ